MRPLPRQRESGSSILEFTLIGIPIIFILISIFEISRGMWIYTSLAHAVREGTRFAVVHGATCSTGNNTCSVGVDAVATVIRNGAVGLDNNQLEVRFNSSCTPNTSDCGTVGLGGSGNYITLTTALGTTSMWPPDGVNRRGDLIEIQVLYPFRSMISMLWPGGSGPIEFGVFDLPASSREQIQF